MGEVLSQNEIDSLLQALSSGELDAEDMKVKDEKQVKNYDFTRPAKFSKEHLRTLEIIFEHYGRLLSTNLPVYLRKTVQVEVMNSEAVTYLNSRMHCQIRFTRIGECIAFEWQYYYRTCRQSGVCNC